MPFVPIYDIRTWRCVASTTDSLRYHPGLVTFLRRLFLAGLCAVGIFAIETGYRSLANPLARSSFLDRPEIQQELQEDHARALEAIRSSMSEDEYLRLVAEAESTHNQRLAELAAAQKRPDEIVRALGVVRQSLEGILAAVAVLALLSCLWNRLTLTRNAREELEISSFFFWPRTGYVALASLYGIQILAVERYGKKRPMSPPDHHWEWIVKFAAAQGSPAPQFHIFKQRRPPGMQGMGPAPVQELAQALHLLTGLPVSPPALISAQRVGRRGVVYDKSMNEPMVSPVRHEARHFSKEEEIPPEIKARIAAMTGNRTELLPGGATRSTRQQIVVTDEQGRSISYDSVDELPEEVRRRFGLH